MSWLKDRTLLLIFGLLAAVSAHLFFYILQDWASRNT